MATPKNKRAKAPVTRKLPANDDKSPLGTVQVAGKVYACGLFWSPFSGPAKARTEEMRTLANEQSMGLYVTRDKFSQAGLGNIQNGVKAGQKSFAAALAGGLALDDIKSFVCAAKLGDRWVYVACFNGIITHDGDVVGDEAKVKAALAGDISARNWDVIIAPTEWGINGAIERDVVADIKRNTRDSNALKTVKRDRKIFIIPALILALSTIAFLLYQQKMEDERLQAEEAERMANELKVSQAGGDELDPVKFVLQCEKFIAEHPQYPGGWESFGAVCDKTGITMTWKRPPYALVAPFEQAVPGAIVKMDGKSAELRANFPPSPSTPSNLIQLSVRLQQLTDAAVASGITLATEPINDPVAKKITWTIPPTFLKPSQILEPLNGVGFKIQVINMTFKEGVKNWDMKGVQYGK